MDAKEFLEITEKECDSHAECKFCPFSYNGKKACILNGRGHAGEAIAIAESIKAEYKSTPTTYPRRSCSDICDKEDKETCVTRLRAEKQGE